MATAASNALTIALRTARAARGEPVAYSRGARSANLTAIRGRAMAQAETAGEVRLEYTDGDWIFLSSDLVFPETETEEAEPIKPQKGDRIATASETFEVLPPANGKTYQATQGVMVRVHSKQVSQ